MSEIITVIINSSLRCKSYQQTNEATDLSDERTAKRTNDAKK